MLQLGENNRPRRLTMIVLASIAAAGLSACDDEPTRPFEEELVLSPGVSVILTVDAAQAPVGSIVIVRGEVRVVDVELTPTAYAVGLNYDPSALEPVESERPADAALRSVNLEAAPGLIVAAGAAAAGIDGGALFAVRMRVRKADYARSLSVDVLELIAVENNFADVASDVLVTTAPSRRGR